MATVVNRPAFTDAELATLRTASEKGRVGLDVLARSYPELNKGLASVNAGAATLRTLLTGIGDSFEDIREALRICQYAPMLVDALTASREEASAAVTEVLALRQRVADAHHSTQIAEEKVGIRNVQIEQLERKVSDLISREQTYRNVLHNLKREIPPARHDLHSLLDGVL